MQNTFKSNYINEDTIFDYNNVFITMDMDWANDDVINYIIDIVEHYSIKVLMFVTHETKCLDRMRNSNNFQLGIHPNFNPLLNGNFIYGKDVSEVLKYFMKIVPEATMIRSHSVTSSTVIKSYYNYFNIKYDLNNFIPKESKIVLYPYKDAFDIINLPYFWEDDIHVVNKFPLLVDQYLNSDGLKIFDFHPIHIFLNTDHMSRYENIKPYFNNTLVLKEHKNIIKFGVEDFFLNLVESLR